MMQAFRTKLKPTVSRNPNFVLGATSCHLGDFLFKCYDIKRASLYKISTSHYNKSSIIFTNELCLGRRLSEYYLTASKLYNARFQVITEVLLTIQVFCDVPSCRLVNSYHVSVCQPTLPCQVDPEVLNHQVAVFCRFA